MFIKILSEYSIICICHYFLLSSLELQHSTQEGQEDPEMELKLVYTILHCLGITWTEGYFTPEEGYYFLLIVVNIIHFTLWFYEEFTQTWWTHIPYPT